MRLSYRGLSYEYSPCTIETVETPITGQFLGLNYRIRRPINAPVGLPSLAVRYRGIPYIGG